MALRFPQIKMRSPLFMLLLIFIPFITKADELIYFDIPQDNANQALNRFWSAKQTDITLFL